LLSVRTCDSRPEQRLKVEASLPPLLLSLRRQIESQIGRLVRRAAAEGRGRGRDGRADWPAAGGRAEHEGAIESLCEAIVALLEDAVVEPLPPMPKPPKPAGAKASKSGGSRVRRSPV
jgi:hypothetical protein